MQDPLSKTLLDQFEQNLNINFEEYCQKYQKNLEERTQFIRYMIDHNLIKDSTIRRYAILQEYTKLIAQAQHKKVEIIKIISGYFNLSERTVYSVIKEYKNYFNKGESM